MKLHTKIAGTLALPLALAVAASSAQAFTLVDTSEHKLTFGGYVSGIASWAKTGDKHSTMNDKVNSDTHLGNSRFNISYTNKNLGATFFYEQQLKSSDDSESDSGRVRHAYFTTQDGWVVGHTWSFGTNLVALADTIDTTPNSLVSFQVYGPRNTVIGKKFQFADNVTFGLAVEGKNNQGGHSAEKSPAPAVTANMLADVNGAKIFAAVTNYAVNKKGVTSGYNTATGRYDSAINSSGGSDKRLTRFTVGTAIPMGDATLKLGATHNHGATYKKVDLDKGEIVAADLAKGTHVSAALTYRFTEKLRGNIAVEGSRWDKDAISKKADGEERGTASRVWVNAFYQADNGIEWGAEAQFANVNAVTWNTNTNLPGGIERKHVTYSSPQTHQGALTDGGYALRVQAKYAF